MNEASDPRTGRPVPLPGHSSGWQVGVGPGAVVVLGAGGADPGGRQVRLLPTGTEGRHPPAHVVALAAGLVHGTDPARPRSGVPGPETAVAPDGRGDTAEVRVRGSGPLAGRLRRALGGLRAETTVRPPPEVAVHQHVVPPEVALAAARTGQQVLPVVVQPRRVVVGPVPTSSGPCLHCLDLHRRDRDPHWAFVASHLGHPVEQVRPAPVPEAVQSVVEGLAVLLVEALRAGRAVQAGLSYEVGPQAPHVVLRRWSRHPGCPWHPDTPARPAPAHA
ncbi:MAG TPA: hypothetical protein VLO09_09365 [Ornithinimicrobium sp.]|nr:hypothetical protein [Ornithinimicrobium sp.]